MIIAATQTPAISSDGRRAVTRAFIANTIPKNRSHDITASVRILATSTITKTLYVHLRGADNSVNQKQSTLLQQTL